MPMQGRDGMMNDSQKIRTVISVLTSKCCNIYIVIVSIRLESTYKWFASFILLLYRIYHDVLLSSEIQLSTLLLWQPTLYTHTHTHTHPHLAHVWRPVIRKYFDRQPSRLASSPGQVVSHLCWLSGTFLRCTGSWGMKSHCYFSTPDQI